MERHELILRLPDLAPDQAARLAAILAPHAARLGGSLSEIVRDHGEGYTTHVSRTAHVASGRRVGPQTNLDPTV